MITEDFIEVRFQDAAHIFTYFKEVNNALSTITTAKISIFKPDNTVLIDNVDMSVTANIATYSWDASAADMDKNHYVKFTINSGNPIVRFFDIYKYPFVVDITDDDLIQENDSIKEGVWEVSGKSDSGSTTTLVDNKLKIEADDYWNGGKLEIIQSNETSERDISAFVQSTGTVTFTPALGVAVGTDEYAIRRSYQNKINYAGRQVQKDFKNIDKRAYLVIDVYQLKYLIIYKFFANYFKKLVKKRDDEYDLQYKHYSGLYSSEFQSMSLTYDENEDAEVTDDEHETKVGEIRWNR